MKYDTVIFDLDGTLLHTLDDLYYSTNYALEQFNFPTRTYEEVRTFVGNGVKVLIEKAVPKGKNEYVEEVLEVFKEHYKSHSMDHIYIYNGIKELIIELKKMNIKIAVVTNKFHAAAEIIVEKYFKDDFLIALGESKELNKKPHPDMCNKVLSILNSKSENTLYVGDSEVDILTAANANLKCISCSWGFRTKDELKFAGANIIIDKPIELLKYLN
jgi:phosphoglycolate phosphatase